MISGLGRNGRILDEIENSDTQEAIKKFLKMSFFFEINRRYGESFKDRYEDKINSTVYNMDLPLESKEED